MMHVVADILNDHADKLNLHDLYHEIDLHNFVDGKRFLLEDAFFIDSAEAARRVVRRGKPAIMVLTPGMMQAGISLAAFKELNNSPIADKSGLFFTGYLDPSTAGYRVNTWGTGSKVWLDNGEVEIRTKVGKYGFSAHLDQSEQISYINTLQPRQVFLVHGDHRARNTLAEKLTQNVVLPRNGAEFTLNFLPDITSRKDVAVLAS